MGQYPSQSDLENKCIATVLACSSISLILPTILQFYVSICDKDLDGTIETLPHLVTTTAGFFNILSLHFNRENFRKVFLTVGSDWENPVFIKDMDILDEVTGRGGRIAYLYRCLMLSFLATFVTIPLVNPMLDIIIPLNETREREEIFSLYYYFMNNEDHFYTIYVHSVWCSTVTVLAIVTVASLNMIITHHASALFAICGSMVNQATERNDLATVGRVSMDDGIERLRECVAAHNKAIQFFEFLDATNRRNFLLQVGFNIVGLSVTAFQTILHLDDTNLAVKSAFFFGGQNFHMFFLNLPGQILSEFSTELLDHIYNSKWYHTPAKMQKMLCIMQLRASRPCQLTAGGLYQLNIQNFGAAFKTCMSYFTMLLSTKE